MTNTLPTNYQEYIHISRYARWLPEAKRRETWEETVDRYIGFFVEKFPEQELTLVGEVRESILSTSTMPSMRCMMTAGVALDRDNVAGFNCAFVAMEEQRAFDEIMYVLMCGTGMGFSVEENFTQELPTISSDFINDVSEIVVRDSKIGWASAYREVIDKLYNGVIPKWDMSKVRGEGERLKTFGGRASGPEPLESLFKYTVNTFRRFSGQRLPPIAVHDLVCKIADIVVVGGVRRSALISLSDRTDEFLRNAKGQVAVKEYTLLEASGEEGTRKYSMIVDDAPYGDRSLILNLSDFESETLQKDHTVEWYHVHPERALANNSIAYEGRPTVDVFLEEWRSLILSRSGERGIFNRDATLVTMPTRRDKHHIWGTNPCSEIILRSKQFCNLSEVIVREDDTIETLKVKVRIATIIGTFQSSLTNFRYLSAGWSRNTREEALLGVSLSGIMDNKMMAGIDTSMEQLGEILTELADVARDTNIEWAEMIGVNPSASITCVKPSGTVSQLVNCASGIHPRYSDYYIRTVRADKKDPLTEMMVESGFMIEDCVMNPNKTSIISFPIKSPEGSVTRDDFNAVKQLELWKVYQLYWCEHKPSITVYVREDEWLEVADWCYKNFDILSGVSFLPHSDHSYRQAPYQEITEDEFKEGELATPTADWTLLVENADNTTGSQELACTAASCDII